jgi:hypothetical protein
MFEQVHEIRIEACGDAVSVLGSFPTVYRDIMEGEADDSAHLRIRHQGAG